MAAGSVDATDATGATVAEAAKRRASLMKTPSGERDDAFFSNELNVSYDDDKCKLIHPILRSFDPVPEGILPHALKFLTSDLNRTRLDLIYISDPVAFHLIRLHLEMDSIESDEIKCH